MAKRPDSTDPAGEEEDEAAALTDLAQLAAELGQAAAESAEEGRIADEVFARINRLTIDAQKRLFTRPAMKRLFDAAGDKDVPAGHDDPPGTIYYRMIGGERTPWSKKPWTWSWLWSKYPTKTWEPSISTPLGFQGLLVTVFAHQETTLPEVFYGVYRDHLSNVRLAMEHAAWLFKKRHALPADPSIITSAGVESRERANHDGAHNVFALNAGVAGIDHASQGDLDAEPARAR